MPRLVLALLCCAGLFAGPAGAEENPFSAEFSYQQQPHPRATGRLHEGYRIHSYYRFLVPKPAQAPDWNAIGKGYLEKVRPGIVHLPDQAGAKPGTVLAAAPLPCDASYIFSRAKEIEQKGAKVGFGNLSSPERSIYNFSRKYIRDVEKITFSRRLQQDSQRPWQAIADHFGFRGKPLWVMDEQLADFNQFAIEGNVLAMVTEHSDSEWAVLGEISLTLDADILDKRVIGLLLSVPLKAALKGLLPTKTVFKRVADKLKEVESASDFQCSEQSATSASLIYGVPNFVDSYLTALRQYLTAALGPR